MIVETSVLVAIALKEPGYEEFVFKIADADERLLSAANYLEASTVLVQRRGESALLELDRLIDRMRLWIVPVSAEQARIGREAYVKFGKGRHKAKLSFGDCFSYALAKSRGLPLLFKGDDFSETDLEIA
jgi:ribonuclease VapC